jgi:thiol-disulfide isomerase/thioredoxin
MPNFIPSLDKWNKKLTLIVITTIFVISIFIALSIYYYKHYIQPKLNKKYIDNKEFVPANGDNNSVNNTPITATLYYFYTTWCPHCKIAIPHWKSLQTKTGGMVNGVEIIFKDIDCDQDSATADKFNVTGYPTIKLVYKDKIYSYDAKPNTDTLLQFLKSVLV